MARQQITVINDDLGGSGQASAVSFTHEGQQYEIDLNVEHAAELTRIQEDYAKAMAPFVAAAQPVARGRAADTADARAWARQEGLQVPKRGPLPTVIMQAYRDHLAGGGAPVHTKAAGIDAREVRSWAAKNGIEVAPRGPISETILRQYEEALLGRHVIDLSRARGDEARQVRSWAAKNGIEVAPRGPISHSVVEQYRLAVG